MVDLFDRIRETSMKRTLLIFALLLCLAPMCVGQFEPASPPIASEKINWNGYKEDLTSLTLTTSHLLPQPPLSSGSVPGAGNNTIQLVRLQWRPADPIDLYILRPKGVERPPVVLYLYGYPADTDRFKEDHFQEAVTRNGFAAVGFVAALDGHRYHDRPAREWFVSELQESLTFSAHDVQMLLDYLAARGDFDMNRVGMVTQGSGASIAILASAVDPRIKVLDAVNPWGDWPDWLATSPMVPDQERADYLKPEFLQKVADLDPTVWLPKVQARKFRLQQVTFAPTTPKSAQEKVRLAVSTETGRATIAIYEKPEELKAVAGEKALEWVQQELKALDSPQASNAGQQQASKK
jgi:hypothetical protein